MEQLFSPWRFDYVTGKKNETGCVFCRIAERPAEDDESSFVVLRANHSFIVLNIYPYTTGHLMIVPFAHERRLAALPASARTEIIDLAARVEGWLSRTYRAQGMNFGINLGRCGGAGIEEHLHLHAVPRWAGDTNFMTVTGNTRVLPEDLRETWRKLRTQVVGDAP